MVDKIKGTGGPPTSTSATSSSPRQGGCGSSAKVENIKCLLSTPTNNFGLGLLFKKFLMLSGSHQNEMVFAFLGNEDVSLGRNS